MRRIGLSILCAALSVAGAQQRLVYPLPDDATTIQKDLVYRTVDGRGLQFDLYRPRAAGVAPLPVVLFVSGIASPTTRGWPQYTGWAKLVTSIGMAAVIFDPHEGAVPEDAAALLAYLQDHADGLHVDATNIILWACSGNAPNGLTIAMDSRHTAIKAAVIYYGAGEVADLRLDLPVLMVRAGLDGVELNRAIDQFVARSAAANLPLTLLNLPSAHHAFDLRDDNDSSRNAIRQTLDFIRTQSGAAMQRQIRDGVTEAAAAAAVYRGDWVNAVKSYEALAAAHPADSEIHRNFANALIGANQHRRAISEYERALELGNPNVGWISYSAAQASLRLGNREDAIRWLGKLKGIVPMQRRLRSDPEFDALKNDPRVQAVLAQ